MEHRSRPTVLVASRLVHAGREEEFGRWAQRFNEAAHECAGGRGGLRLEQPDGLIHFVQRFASEEDARGWLASDVRRGLAAEADAFSREHHEIATGDNAQVRLPSELSVPKWKLWLATWAAVFPLLLLLNAAIKVVAGGLPQPVQLAIMSLAMTAVLTWFVLPELRKRLRPWLFRDDKDGSLKKEPG